jgi:hypothetical protein
MNTVHSILHAQPYVFLHRFIIIIVTIIVFTIIEVVGSYTPTLPKAYSLPIFWTFFRDLVGFLGQRTAHHKVSKRERERENAFVLRPFLVVFEPTTPVFERQNTAYL